MTKLAVLVALLAALTVSSRLANAAMVDLCGEISSDESLAADDDVTLSCQAFVKAGATLTIEAGTTIKAAVVDDDTPAPALIIERGGTIMAEGTADAPITFTVDDDSLDPSADDFDARDARGKWGGLIVLGNAPVQGDEQSVEGLPEGMGLYGGDDPEDNSGVLSYVRVWFGGSVIGENNEINGITFGGVGNGTTVDHIEVAFNLDDGVEFFGGTVNVKYLSVLFVGDDAVDTDLGYSGKLQFVFVLVDPSGHHGTEMDSDVDGATPRSFPQMYNALFVGSLTQDPSPVSSDDRLESMLRLRETTGGEFGNIVMVNVPKVGLLQTDCGDELRTDDFDAATDAGAPDYLWFSTNNIYNGVGEQFSLEDGCEGLTTMDTADAGLTSIPEDAVPGASYDPRPTSGSAVFDSVDSVPSDGFYDEVDFRGAFSADDLWLDGWSWLSDNNRFA